MPRKPPATTVTATLTLKDSDPIFHDDGNAATGDISTIGWERRDSQDYLKGVGLYAPNWPDHVGGTCVLRCHQYIFGDQQRDPIIGTLTFAVAPSP